MNSAAATQPTNKRQTAQEMIAANIKSLIAQLEAGHSEALTAYLNAMSRFHNYSFGNVLEIARQKPDAIRVAGMYAWNQLGRRVKEGENGIRILAPIMNDALLRNFNRADRPAATGDDVISVTQAGSPRASDMKVANASQPKFQKHRILCVDDEVIGTTMRAEVLRQHGYSVDLYHSPVAALRCDISMFELAILDFEMPELNGRELLLRLRA